MLPYIAGDVLIPGFADKIAWIVPRDSLRYQGARKLEGFQTKLIEVANNLSQSKDFNGYVSTYQAVASDLETHLKEVSNSRYVLFLDEPQHLAEDSLWGAKVLKLAERCALVVTISGDIYRGDGSRVSVYKYDGNQPFMETNNDQFCIKYGYDDAVADEAIVPPSFVLLDVAGEISRNEESFGKLSDLKPKVERKALRSVVANTDEAKFAKSMIRECRNHFAKYRQFVRANYDPAFSNKMLIATDSQDVARKVASMDILSGAHTEIAISDDPDSAKKIQKFRDDPNCAFLVTVQMAYEGLDVPEITHICNLNAIRSFPWMYQLVHRATRRTYDIPYGVQQSYIFSPYDSVMKEFISKRFADRDMAIDIVEPKEQREGGSGGGGFARENIYVDKSRVSATILLDGREDAQGIDWLSAGDRLEKKAKTGGDDLSEKRDVVSKTVVKIASKKGRSSQSLYHILRAAMKKGLDQYSLSDCEKALRILSRFAPK